MGHVRSIAQPITTILYTTESADSTRRAEEDLKVRDPAPERATAVLRGPQSPQGLRTEEPPHESKRP